MAAVDVWQSPPAEWAPGPAEPCCCRMSTNAYRTRGLPLLGHRLTVCTSDREADRTATERPGAPERNCCPRMRTTTGATARRHAAGADGARRRRPWELRSAADRVAAKRWRDAHFYRPREQRREEALTKRPGARPRPTGGAAGSSRPARRAVEEARRDLPSVPLPWWACSQPFGWCRACLSVERRSQPMSTTKGRGTALIPTVQAVPAMKESANAWRVWIWSAYGPTARGAFFFVTSSHSGWSAQ